MQKPKNEAKCQLKAAENQYFLKAFWTKEKATARSALEMNLFL